MVSLPARGGSWFAIYAHTQVTRLSVLLEQVHPSAQDLG